MIRISKPSKICDLGRKRKRADCVLLEEYAKTHANEGQGNKIIWNCQLYFICFLFHFFKTQQIDMQKKRLVECGRELFLNQGKLAFALKMYKYQKNNQKTNFITDRLKLLVHHTFCNSFENLLLGWVRMCAAEDVKRHEWCSFGGRRFARRICNITTFVVSVRQSKCVVCET